MGKIRSVPLGVQADPGLVGTVADQPKNAPPAFRTGQATQPLVQDRSEMRSTMFGYEAKGILREASQTDGGYLHFTGGCDG